MWSTAASGGGLFFVFCFLLRVWFLGSVFCFVCLFFGGKGRGELDVLGLGVIFFLCTCSGVCVFFLLFCKVLRCVVFCALSFVGLSCFGSLSFACVVVCCCVL